MTNAIRLAAVQAEPVWLDIDGTVSKTIGLIESAATQDVDLIAFPETWIPGYPVFLWSLPAPEQMPFVGRYHANSMTVGGPHMKAIREAARDNSIMIAIGFSEKAHGSLYMSQTVIGAQGQILIHRRKLKPTHVERTLFGEGDGSDLQVVDTALGLVGALNCWEHLQPLTKYAMYAQNEQIHVAGWPCFGILDAVPALSHEANIGASKTYALEGSCFVLASTQIMSDEGIKTFVCADGSIPTIYNGGGGFATIFGPDSSQLSENLDPHDEGFVVADVNVESISYAKNAADPAGHYSRPDVTQLLFNNAPQRAVIGEGLFGTEVVFPELEPAEEG
ncbi:carbon-nitrogen hydrolase family protein [Paramicrobacterium chengjingii]|uniref:Carbon-nitrogen hydrolase family protein n=1 Tax=Paramicrobacterium chengjingii TaxID=2769067 RepID=A0ABX6YL94_9MICO|nr:carbon-nitrogen hydrolase family protein [Microbacterium chengjingii]QPZ39562.1 carbon-nitrogen hydrolase family protein [Microbacterium chengjingii]